MDDYLVGVLSNIGVISFIALSAYLLLLTGEISFGQQAFFAIGAYAAGIATALWGWPLAAALVLGRRRGARPRPCWSACRPCACTGSISPIATLAFAEMVRLLFEQFRYQVMIDGEPVGPNGTDGFRGIRYIFENDVGPLQFLALIYVLLAAALAGFMLLERSRLGVAFRMIGEDATLAALNGIAVARVKVLAAGACRRARRSRRRALRAPDHLPRAAHLRRDARRAQPRLWPDRRARHRVRAAARRADRHRPAGIDQGVRRLSHDHLRRPGRACC